jgi:hypothetical protein
MNGHLYVGIANSKIKEQTIQWIIQQLSKQYPKLSNIDNNTEIDIDWKDPMWYSVVLQPFIISPAINIGDICACLKLDLHSNNESLFVDNNNGNSSNNVDQIIYNHHPFPVLERVIDDGTTHAFIPMDMISKITPYEISKKNNINFGLGPRICPGIQYANIIMSTMIPELIKCRPNFKPQENHLYSGRSNDGHLSFTELYHQVRIILIVFVKKVSWLKLFKTILVAAFQMRKHE